MFVTRGGGDSHMKPLFVFYFWSSRARFPFPFQFKDSFDTDSNVLVKNGSQTKVSQGLVFRRDDHDPGFEFITFETEGRRGKECGPFCPFSVPWISLFPEKNRMPDRRFVDPQLRSSTLIKSSGLLYIFDRFYFVSYKKVREKVN